MSRGNEHTNKHKSQILEFVNRWLCGANRGTSLPVGLGFGKHETPLMHLLNQHSTYVACACKPPPLRNVSALCLLGPLDRIALYEPNLTNRTRASRRTLDTLATNWNSEGNSA